MCTFGCSAVVPGCGDENAPGEENRVRAGSFVQTAERGPVRMTIALDRLEITPAERFKLTVEVVAARGINVEMPRLGDRMSGLTIRDHCEYPDESYEGRWRRRREYRLDAFLPGEYTIPKMTATFVDGRAGDDAPAEAEVTVNEFIVVVVSQAEGKLDPLVFRNIKGPVPLSSDRAWAWGSGGGLAGAAVVTLVVLWVLRHRSREVPEKMISAHEWALRQLQGLVDDQLVERGLVDEFYFRLSMIIRRYVERRFGVRALNRTTDEFMLETQGGPTLSLDYHGTVGNFLRACDMVKFARHAPQAEEINEALKKARDFVDQSAENESQWMTAA